jgi:hypothetical protein
MTFTQSNCQSSGVRLGAMRWSNPAWRETFYPADMPDDWQLTFFNTQFNCVFLERADWQQANPDLIAQWNADTHEQFIFLLEDEGSMPLPVELTDKGVLVRRDDPSILWFSRDTSLKELAAALSGNSGATPRFLISRDGDLGQMERVTTLLEVMGL